MYMHNKLLKFGHCPEGGGGSGLAQIVWSSLYVYLTNTVLTFLGAKYHRGGGIPLIWAMPKFKHFFMCVNPYINIQCHQLSPF